jgi:signal transduction histidine kinase
MANLTDNAVKYNSAQGFVSVRASSRPDGAAVVAESTEPEVALS